MATKGAASRGSDETVSMTQAIYLLGASAVTVLVMTGVAFYQLHGAGPTETTVHAGLNTPLSEQSKTEDKPKETFTNKMLKKANKPRKARKNGSSGGGTGTSSGEGINAGADKSKRSSGGPKLVRTFKGSGTQKLNKFSVEGDWSIRWKSDSRFFAAYLHKAKSGELVKTISSNNTNRANFDSLPGDYYLTVNTIGDWKIQVVRNQG